MLRILYLSTATGRPDDPSLQRILEVSRRNNRRADVTGVLCAGGEHFLQVLEGPDDAVMETYHRIRHDPRHTQATLLDIDLIDARLFPEWSMAHIAGSSSDEAIRSALRAVQRNTNRRGHVLATLRAFVQIHRLRAVTP